jgi:hypothetical protein
MLCALEGILKQNEIANGKTGEIQYSLEFKV